MSSNPFKIFISKIKKKREDKIKKKREDKIKNKMNDKYLVFYCKYCKIYFDCTHDNDNNNDNHKRYAKANSNSNSIL